MTNKIAVNIQTTLWRFYPYWAVLCVGVFDVDLRLKGILQVTWLDLEIVVRVNFVQLDLI